MELRKSGMAETVEAELNAWRRRMHDVSEFAKTYKDFHGDSPRKKFF